MKRINIFIFMMALSFLFLTACSSSSHDDTASNVSVPYESFAALEFDSMKELYKVINDVQTNKKSELTQEYAEQIKSYDIKGLSKMIIPSFIPKEAELDAIYVKDNYVAFDYILNSDTSKPGKNARETEINRMLNTLVFEWSRYEDGETLLKDTIIQQDLLPLNEKAGVYYADIFWPDEPELLLGRNLFWLQDGYRCMAFIPASQLDFIDVGAETLTLKAFENLSLAE